MHRVMLSRFFGNEKGGAMSSRRDFIAGTIIGSVALGLEAQTTRVQATQAAKTYTWIGAAPRKNIIISSANGIHGIDKGYEILSSGGDTLDAAIAVGKVQEDDPNDHSVGYGGLPNEDGVVELDACCMHGPSRMAGSVGAIQNIRHACLVARLIMERSGHVMLTGQGAEHFAVMHGLKREDLLTDDARKMWLLWKESRSSQNFWGPPMSAPGGKDANPAPVLNHSAIPRHPGPEWSEIIRVRSQQLSAMAADLGIPPQKRALAAAQILW